MAFAPFVPLRVLSSYSLLEGAIDPKAIARLAKERGFPAIAICDRNGLYGTSAFAAACKGDGIQPIVGTLLGVARGPDGPVDHLPLFAQDEAGWHNLCALVSRAHLERPLEQAPHVPLAVLDGRTDGLIALTGANEGAAARLLADGKADAAEQYLAHLARLFPGRLYIELARRGDPIEEAAEGALIDLAYRLELPLVATNPAMFGDPHMHAAHDAMLCIANSTHLDSAERPRSIPEAFIKSAPMMQELFADLPEATANTLVVAQRCAFAPPRRKPILPSLAGDQQGEARALAEDARAGLAARLASYAELNDDERETYAARLEFELDVIVRMGFPGYFLIVADFIKWAKSRGIPVGPGRGSGAGSLVAWSLTITDLDPIRLGLLFERFLNPERVSMPDFDIDFCETRRGEVIRYVQDRYGHDRVELEGFPRNSSTHAAGVVIGDRPLAELVPLYRDPRSDMPVTQFDMKYVEDAGLVKFDFLGLKTLSVLAKAVELLAARGIDIDLAALPWDDPAVYTLLQRGDTVGVFQLESEGMRRTLSAVKPTRFEDIIALGALYRPGPMDNIPLFGRRKNGQEATEYPHPKLAEILAETYGIFVYQEQVMQAAQILAGYSLGDADLLRRAMGKKIQAEMDAQRARFVEGCRETSGIAAPKANELFDLIDKFAGYGFNKSHAAAYAVLSYQTAWLKAHYPEDFYAASMCFDMHQSEKLAVFVDDLRRGGVTLLPPDINASEAEFSVEPTDDGHAVRYALAGIRNVGEKAMEAIVTERAANGRFASLEDLFRRMPPGAMNRRQLDSLAASGAFDSIDPDRAKVLANGDLLLALADAVTRERASGQGGLFGGDGEDSPALRLAPAEPWTRAEQMAAERENFGFYFAAHPVERFRAVASANGARSYGSLMAGGIGAGRQPAVLAALVEGVSSGRTRKGAPFIRGDFSDTSGQFSAACFEEGLVESFQRWAGDSTCVLLNVELDSTSPDEPPRVTVRGARPLAEVTSTARMLLTADVHTPEALQQLRALLIAGDPGNGRGEVIVRLHVAEGSAPCLRLGRDFVLDGELAERLSEVDGLTNIALKPQGPRAHLREAA
ncbi:MAG: DNA polymerase III subunit alpha [Sphingomonadales bacterium 32-68-7]|nr:MAG: DNA polymerase III subunit alpha [Sphingomonadales bacterium 32-68-7]